MQKIYFLGVLAVSVILVAFAGGASAQMYYPGACVYHSSQQCVGNLLYWYDSCGHQEDVAQYCQNGCYGNSCENYNNNYNNYNNYNNCAQYSSQRCSGNYLYWYDSCGNQESQSQYCPNGCIGNACVNNYNQNYNNYNQYNSYGNCTYHAYQLCSGNNIYWFNSCGIQQDFVQSCSGINTICKAGQCVYQAPYIAPAPAPAPAAVPQYSAHYKISCYANNLYWYDSNGRTTGLYQNCADANSCTLDSCVSGKCSNILKCDGSTCAVGSADYNTYCMSAQSGTGSSAQNSPISQSPLSVSFFAKPDMSSSQWQKTVSIGSDGQTYFMISVLNNSAATVSNINVSANIPDEISSVGNLQIDGVQVSGDIVAGVSIGSLSPGGAKSITFEGKTQSVATMSTKQAVATVSTPSSSQSDSVAINLNPGQEMAASVSSAASSSDFWAFIKRWYLWILVGIVLLFLFVVVFRRLSSNA